MQYDDSGDHYVVMTVKKQLTFSHHNFSFSLSFSFPFFSLFIINMANKKATCYILNVNHAMSLYPDNVFSKSLETITCSIEDRVSFIH